MGMTEHPIIFSAPMVRAILSGQKTQTRRIVKPQPDGILNGEPYWNVGGYRAWDFRDILDPLLMSGNPLTCPYGKAGGRLWVRETWALVHVAQAGEKWVVYREGDNRTDYGGPWKPSIFMPRSASRITLEITDVCVQLLGDIRNADARAEGACGVDWGHGMDYGGDANYRPDYKAIWESINGMGSWDANPWVWKLTFRRITP